VTRFRRQLLTLAALLALLALAGCGGAGAATGSPATVPVTSEGSRTTGPLDSGAIALAREVWSALDRTTNTCDDQFDYFPHGGARIFACHLFSLLSFEQFVAASGLRPFVSGPHTQGLDFTATTDFGHYDPAFVQFLADHAVPAARDPLFRAATQAHYDRYVWPLARIMHATHEKLVSNPECYAAELEEYGDAIANGYTADYVEPWFFFMNPTYCSHRRADYDVYQGTDIDGGYDGNVTKTAVGFWLRRSLDGTEPAFFEALVQLMSAYETRAP